MPAYDMPVPAALNGETLAAELAAATGRPAAEFVVSLAGAVLTVTSKTAVPKAVVTAAVAAHTGAASPWVGNRQTVLDKAAQALADNAAYLAALPATNVQVAAQVAAITRQVNALIRLVTDALDSTTGT